MRIATFATDTAFDCGSSMFGNFLAEANAMSHDLGFSISGFASGSLTIDDNGYVTAISGTANGQQITGLASFGGADNQLDYAGQEYSGSGSGFILTNVYYNVDQMGLSFTAGGVSYVVSGVPYKFYYDEPVNISNSANPSVQSSTLTAGYTEKTISLCFAAGTRIATIRGELAVERLAAGDVVLTADHRTRPIAWIGHRTIDCRRHPDPASIMPVRIAAGAFGAGRPARDLYLSPGHPLLVDADAACEGGHLVPIMCLINGTTIARTAVDEVTYWHLELDTHDILLAEDLPAESYIDLGSRPWFEGAYGALHDPDLTLPAMPGRCRPVAIDGPVVEAERRRLDMVFAMQLEAACAWPDEAYPGEVGAHGEA